MMEQIGNLKIISPKNWTLVENYEGNFIFENSEKSYCVNVDFVSACAYPYAISFLQLRGQFKKIGIEDGAYSTHSLTLPEALVKANNMMLFINESIFITN